MKNRVKRSHFDLSHERKLTCKADGSLYPILVENMLPGDNFKVNSEILARMTPLTYPVYHKFDVFTHFFFVPYRLVWDNWRQFISPEFVGNTHTIPTFPAFKIRPNDIADYSAASINSFEPGKLADHMGIQLNHFGSSLPLANISEESFSSLPFRAYQLIWNEYFRDVDLQEAIAVVKSDGYDDVQESGQFDLLKRCWEKDYFTSCRPYAQKGNPVTVPSVGPVEFVNATPTIWRDINGTTNPDDTTVISNFDGNLKTDAAGRIMDGIKSTVVDNSEALQADTAFTIKDLRYANTMQKFLEKLFRGGSRYNETLKSIFGVHVKDERLQRPEFLGGGRQPFVISEVLQSSQTQETPLGTFAGHAITNGKHMFDYYAPEHGVVIGLMSIMPRTAYTHVVRRHFTYSDRFEFPTPDFAHIGEQEVRNYEINGKLTTSDGPSETFGYQDRFAECKNIPSTVHGLFRQDEALVRFHAARLDSDFSLNEDFVQITNSDFIERIFALDTGDFDPFLVTIQHNISAVRPLPRRSIPKL